MKKYEKEVMQAQIDNEKAVLKKIEKNYSDALAEINDKIAILLGRSDADQQHVIYQIEYQKSLKKQIEAILETLHSNEFETVSEYLTKSYEEGFIGTMYSLQEQGVPLVIPIDQEQVVNAIQHETKLSESLYASLGKDTKELSKKIAGEISRGISTGMMYADIARNISGYARIPKNNAMRIARTEAHRIQCKASMDACEKAKSKGADVYKQWNAALDSRTRESHVRVDREIREIDKPFSNGLMYPSDPKGRPEEVINCRCALNQRASWLLDVEETQHLGNVSEMSEKQKEAIAKKLNVPVDELEQYSDQIVPIKAKDYDDFKRQYNNNWHYEGSDLQKEAEERIAGYKKGKSSERVRQGAQKIKSNGCTDVTEKWFDRATPSVGNIKEADKYTYNGIDYVIDGINVKQNNSKRELEVADLLFKKFGGEIQLIPEVNGNIQNVKTPDYLFNGKRYDLKEMVSRKEDGIRNAVHKKREQADNFIIDITKSEITDDELNVQIEKVFNSYNTQFFNSIIVIKGEDIVKILNKK